MSSNPISDSYQALGSRILELEAQLETCRETNSRLNRRCQVYERGLHEKLEKGRDEYRNLGRALANAAATSFGVKLDDIEALCRGCADHPLASEILDIIERNIYEDCEKALQKGDTSDE